MKKEGRMIRIVMPICDDNLFTLKMSSYLFDKYWPKDTTIDVIGFKKPDFEISSKMNFISLASKQEGGASGWSKYILSYLQNIEDEQVIFTLEDFFPTKSPNIKLIKNVSNLLKSNSKIGRFDLTFDSYSFGKYTIVKKIKNLTIINKEKYTEYRITTQPSLWNKEFLMDILRNTTSPWDFEINGTKYSNSLDYQVLAFGDETYENFPTYWIHKGAVSRQYPGKINVLGIDLKTIKEMVEKKLFQESDLVWGMWNHGKIPSFHELGGYNFNLAKMPINDASRSNWKEYRHVYVEKSGVK